MSFKTPLCTTTLFIAALAPGFVNAQGSDGPIGFVGAGTAYGDLVETRTPDSQLTYMPYYLEGQVSFPIFGNGRLGASGFVSFTDWDMTQPNFDADVPENEMRLSLGYTQTISNDFRVGAFGVYTRSALVTDDLQREPYETLYGGLSALYFLGDDFMVFGQAGVGDTLAFPPDQSVLDPEGFNDGSFLSTGVTWFPVDSTSITVDFETARAGVYQNGGSDADTGNFASIGLAGETLLPIDFPLAATYFVRRDYFESDAGINLNAVDLTFGVGFRILFGGATPRDTWRAGRMLDAPRLPARAVDWVEVLD